MGVSGGVSVWCKQWPAVYYSLAYLAVQLVYGIMACALLQACGLTSVGVFSRPSRWFYAARLLTVMLMHHRLQTILVKDNVKVKAKAATTNSSSKFIASTSVA